MDGRKYAISVAAILTAGLLVVPWLDFQDPEDQFRREPLRQDNLAEGTDESKESPSFELNSRSPTTVHNYERDQGPKFVVAEPSVGERRMVDAQAVGNPSQVLDLVPPERTLLTSQEQLPVANAEQLSGQQLRRPVAQPKFELTEPSNAILPPPAAIEKESTPQPESPVPDGHTQEAAVQVFPNDESTDEVLTPEPAFDLPVPAKGSDRLEVQPENKIGTRSG